MSLPAHIVALQSASASSGAPLYTKGADVARRRYQKGCLLPSKGSPKPGEPWIGRWREDVIKDGKITRPLGWFPLGMLEDLPTRRLAERELARRLEHVNNPSYRPRPVAKFSEFAEKWQLKILPNLKPSSRAPIKSQLRKHLIPSLGTVTLKDFTSELVQSFITDCKLSPKTIKNLIGTLRIMWNTAKAWEYVDGDPFSAVVMPEYDSPEQPMFSRDDVKRITAAVDQHYRPALWLLTQTGIRRGELCALNIGDVNFEMCYVDVRRSRSGKHITNTKSKHSRPFPISSKLADALKLLAGNREAGEPLFVTVTGKRLHPDNFSARVIRPVIKALGLKGGLHAFRHGNATAMDSLNVPMATRQQRLGHVDARTTMIYTHVTEDSRKVPEMLDEYFSVGMVQ